MCSLIIISFISHKIRNICASFIKHDLREDIFHWGWMNSVTISSKKSIKDPDYSHEWIPHNSICVKDVWMMSLELLLVAGKSQVN